ncbi:MAG: hypothetical protein IJK52_12285 [Oscillospiraceae bacterium]|nr:hypothetical protein [Oscillospiraceae bacterium]
MVKTMKRSVSLLFVLSLLVSMLAIPAKATNGSKSVALPSIGKSTDYVYIYSDKSFLGLKKTTVTVTNTSKTRSVFLYKNLGSIGYEQAGELPPGRSKSFPAKANGTTYSFQVQRGSGSGNASVTFAIKNGY